MVSEEKGVINTLALINNNLAGTREYLVQITQTETLLLKSLKHTNKEIDSLEVNLREQNQAMQNRIKELYIKGRYGEWEVLLNLLQEKSPPQRQWEQVRFLIDADQKMVRHISEAKLVLEQRQKELSTKTHELTALRKVKSAEEEGLSAQHKNQQAALATLRESKSLQEKALREYERNQKVMLALIKKLEERKKKEEAEAKRRREQALAAKKKPPPVKVPPKAVGPKCVPVNGPIISGFGMQEHKLLRTFTKNLGVEIQAARGTSVKAAAAGTVVLVSRIEGRGPAVIIDHGNSYYSVYGHLQKISVKEGQELRHCQVLGETSEVESINGPKLYFQVSEGTHTVDPMEWLKK